MADFGIVATAIPFRIINASRMNIIFFNALKRAHEDVRQEFKNTVETWEDVDADKMFPKYKKGNARFAGGDIQVTVGVDTSSTAGKKWSEIDQGFEHNIRPLQPGTWGREYETSFIIQGKSSTGEYSPKTKPKSKIPGGNQFQSFDRMGALLITDETQGWVEARDWTGGLQDRAVDILEAHVDAEIQFWIREMDVPFKAPSESLSRTPDPISMQDRFNFSSLGIKVESDELPPF